LRSFFFWAKLGLERYVPAKFALPALVLIVLLLVFHFVLEEPITAFSLIGIQTFSAKQFVCAQTSALARIFVRRCSSIRERGPHRFNC